ncbi:hypothetical protein Ahy_A03g012556 [Arachis hypogaea]|uniref:Uncharacterized protein n=1 Tax=Arachis hypogaea TaxID=3818 RepID=A0A445DTL5_ARAHY|nr:hypothetical protein Ahy_A03g012556 [Arachis hypogaea]
MCSFFLYGTGSTMPSSRRYTTIEWVGGCNRCWRMYMRSATTSLHGFACKSRRLYKFTGRLMRSSGIGVSQTELTGHRPNRPSILVAQRPS